MKLGSFPTPLFFKTRLMTHYNRLHRPMIGRNDSPPRRSIRVSRRRSCRVSRPRVVAAKGREEPSLPAAHLGRHGSPTSVERHHFEGKASYKTQQMLFAGTFWGFLGKQLKKNRSKTWLNNANKKKNK